MGFYHCCSKSVAHTPPFLERHPTTTQSRLVDAHPTTIGHLLSSASRSLEVGLMSVSSLQCFAVSIPLGAP